MPSYAADLDSVRTAAERIAGFVHRTPVATSATLDRLAGRHLFFKCEQVQDLDALIVPVGGGGLLSGTCIAARGIRPQVKLYAAEPLGADDAARSFSAGTLMTQTSPNTIADGLLTSLGQLTWPIIRDHIEAVITVSDAEIIAAMRLAWERAKLLVEASAAVGLAAALSAAFRSRPGLARVGILLSGGNVDLERLPW